MATPVRNVRIREESSSLRELTRPTSSSGECASGTTSHLREESSLLRLLQESTRSNFSGEDSRSTASLEAATNSSVLQLGSVVFREQNKFPELVLTLGHTNDDNKSILVVTQRSPSYHPPFGYTSRVHITIKEDCSYQVHVLMHKLESGVVSNEGEVHSLLKWFSSASSSKFCPGIEWTYYQEHYFDVIRFDIKSVRRTEAPFYRVDSVNCKLWFELPSNAAVADKALAEVLCSACKRLITDLNWQLKRTTSESPSRKMNGKLLRQGPD